MTKIKLTKEKLGWILFDVADSSFITVIVTVLFSMYFYDVVVGQQERGTFLWSVATSITMLLVTLLAPIMGAIADYSSSRKRLLVCTTYITILFTALLFTIGEGEIFWAMLFFIIAYCAFSLSNGFYYSFLPDIAEKHEMGRISGISWGIGYLGGLAALFLCMPIVQRELPNNLSYRLSFLLIAIFFAIFSAPTFLWLKEKRKPNKVKKNYILVGFSRLAHTAKNVREFDELIKFLVSFFLYNSGISVVIFFASIYGKSRFGMGAMDMLVYFVIAQPASFVGAIVFGYILDRIGTKKSINITLYIWIAVILAAYFSMTKLHYYGVGVLAGFAIGSSQANSRTMFALLSPQSKSSEFFGFYTVIGGFSAILAPLIYGIIAQLTGDQRNSIISCLIFFVLGLIVMQFVNEKKGERIAQEMNKRL